MTRHNIDYKDVIRMYSVDGYTYKEIASYFNCSTNLIRKIAKRHGVKSIRGPSKYRKIIISKSKLPLKASDTDLGKNLAYFLGDIGSQVCLGSLIGDSYLKQRKNKSGFTYNIYMSHKMSHVKYLEYKKSLINNVNPIRIERRKNNSSSYDNAEDLCMFSTKPFTLSSLYNELYSNKVKRITKEYLKCLTPLSLAIWYMDDGSFNKQNRVIRIATMCFNDKDNKILKDYFVHSLRMPCFFEKVNCGFGKSLVLTQNSTKKFLKLIDPYKCDIMEYKFPTLQRL